MLVVINFLACVVVAAAVAYHYYVFFDTKKNTEIAIQQTRTKAKSDVDEAKTALTSDISNARQQASDDLTRTKSDVDTQFRTLGEQITTKNLQATSLKTDNIKLGQKWIMSGTGDVQANDEWLRLMNKDGKDYYGGMAMGQLYTGSKAYLNGTTNVSGNLQLGDKWSIPTSGPKANDEWLRVMDKNGKDYYGGVAMGQLYTGSKAYLNGTTNVSGSLQFGDKWSIPTSGAKANDEWLRVMDKDGKDYYGGIAMSKLYTKDNSFLNGNTNVSGNLQLGDKWSIPTTGAQANDEWVRVMDKDGKDYYGGLAVKKLWTRDNAYLNGNVNVIGRMDVVGQTSSSGDVRGGRLCVQDVCINKDDLTKIKKLAA